MLPHKECVHTSSPTCPHPEHSQSIWLLMVRALLESTFTSSSGTSSFSGIRFA